jgi:excisionase family DNA binding protein
MLTVNEAARRLNRNPETVRRWIRSGRLPARKIGTQHVIDEADIDEATGEDLLPVPRGWKRTSDGEPMPDIVSAVRRSRAGR